MHASALDRAVNVRTGVDGPAHHNRWGGWARPQVTRSTNRSNAVLADPGSARNIDR